MDSRAFLGPPPQHLSYAAPGDAEDGTLLATASQSCILRLWKDQSEIAPPVSKEDP